MFGDQALAVGGVRADRADLRVLGVAESVIWSSPPISTTDLAAHPRTDTKAWRQFPPPLHRAMTALVPCEDIALREPVLPPAMDQLRVIPLARRVSFPRTRQANRDNYTPAPAAC
ncbi:hypothetical protein AB0892_02270 [Streptomyces sp. NPDC005409]|uniref:hypothetical protein n=1 Tax=Streptomyces sp. NPDC005409 TaxID=3155342 RepID=UPI003456C6EC